MSLKAFNIVRGGDQGILMYLNGSFQVNRGVHWWFWWLWYLTGWYLRHSGGAQGTKVCWDGLKRESRWGAAGICWGGSLGGLHRKQEQGRSKGRATHSKMIFQCRLRVRIVCGALSLGLTSLIDWQERRGCWLVKKTYLLQINNIIGWADISLVIFVWVCGGAAIGLSSISLC